MVPRGMKNVLPMTSWAIRPEVVSISAITDKHLLLHQIDGWGWNYGLDDHCLDLEYWTSWGEWDKWGFHISQTCFIFETCHLLGLHDGCKTL
jgi:hypothetical protein